jgi:glycosyltransferase involved in cell wall biosynthesis
MKISILIPCYNAERWIAQAIRSALDQQHCDREVVVVDDGSTDGSLAIIQTFGDRIRWESGPNRGGNVARNRLLELAQGAWVQYLDADDYLLPQKLAEQAEFVERSPDVDVVYSPIIMEHWHDGAPWRREVLPIPEPRDPWVLLARWQLPQTGTCLWRTRALEEVGGWRPDQPCCQEHELCFRLLAAGKRLEYHPAAGAVYRQWSLQTVCRRDPLLTFRKRLEIVGRLEEHLRADGSLTEPRRAAIAQARLECARSLYHLDRRFALAVARHCREGNPSFRPPAAAPFPRSYRVAYRLLGFAGAELMADCVRPFRQRT